MKAFTIVLRENAILIFIVLDAHLMVLARDIAVPFAQ